MPWEALCLVSRYGPVTTDPEEGEAPITAAISGKSTVGARRGLSTNDVEMKA